MAKVLIIEDSPAQAAIIAEIVKHAGHEPLSSPNITNGVGQALKSLNPDIVLLDLVLLGPDGKPMADGYQMCREIKRSSDNKIGVIIVSSKGGDESAEWAVLQGADAFLEKPFAVEDLVSVMSEVLENLKR